MIVEACVETLGQALAAQAGGAHRLELCTSLASDGLTPPDDLLTSCLNQVTLPVFCLVRPRVGSFVYTPGEVDMMRRQVRQARSLGARGIVLGALDRHDRVDAGVVAALVSEAQPLAVTFHRAFDKVPDPRAALDVLVSLGVSRVLTSGGAPTATKGIEVIARLVRQSEARIIVVAAGGIRAHNVRDIAARTGVREVHGRFGSAADVRAVTSAVQD